MSLNPGQTNLVRGTFSGDCTMETDLIRNQQKFPAIRQMLERVDQRQLTTLLTSGAITPYGIDMKKPTKFGKIKEGQAIGDSQLRFNVIGRIQKAATILSQYGTSGTDGSFQLIMKDNYVYKGQVCTFTNSYVAMAMSQPAQVASGWLYTFQHPQKENFVWATFTAAQGGTGTYTCFPSTTGYGEKSLKGYGRDQFPDTFIVDMTTQRATAAISGDAASDVLWYQYFGDKGVVKGWKFEKVRQKEAQWAMENEYAKIFGVSTMKNADGSRASVANLTDTDTGNGITMGDGILEQISGGNEIFGSGPDGYASVDDFIDANKILTKKSSTSATGVNVVYMTGIDGYISAQRKMGAWIATQSAQLMQSVQGGDEIEVGYNITKFNFGGSSTTFVQHPLFDDDARFTEKGSDGQSLMSGTYIGGDLGSFMDSNIEIIPKGANGSNRSNVTMTINGMTGLPGEALTEEDAWKYAMLKQDLLVIYDTSKWVVIRKTP